MAGTNYLLDRIILKGLVNQDDLRRAAKQGRERGMSEIDWLLAEQIITPQDLFEAAKAVVSDQDAGHSAPYRLNEDLNKPSHPNESEALSSIVGESEHIKNLKTLIKKIAATDAPVLIHGESGTGKELVAKAIHRLSRRADHQFVTLNCSAVPAELIESELFGHKKGAFTGAVADNPGVFRAADHGTLFLDEIEATSTSMQAKLLRALQEGEIKAVGEVIPSFVDVRFISASNSDLAELVQRGKFRQDLLFRITVFDIFVPPLRERSKDIPLLINHFLTVLSGPGSGKPMRIDPPALELLCKYPWPGNVRELQNEIQRALVMAGEGSTISVGCLSEKITRGADWVHPNTAVKKTLKEAVEALERDLVKQALDESKGKRHLAARMLGLSRQGLLNKIHKYKISIV